MNNELKDLMKFGNALTIGIAKVDGKTNGLYWVVLEVNIFIFYCSIATKQRQFP